MCANEQYYLLRTGAPTSLERIDAETFINAAINCGIHGEMNLNLSPVARLV